ncbi:MAG: hypothetical protein ACLVCH_02490 [Roseburia inulinivorans]
MTIISCLKQKMDKNALAVLEEKYQAVTVIILDLIMPDMSGLELLEIFLQRCKISEYTCDRDVERHQ